MSLIRMYIPRIGMHKCNLSIVDVAARRLPARYLYDGLKRGSNEEGGSQIT